MQTLPTGLGELVEGEPQLGLEHVVPGGRILPLLLDSLRHLEILALAGIAVEQSEEVDHRLVHLLGPRQEHAPAFIVEEAAEVVGALAAGGEGLFVVHDLVP